MEKKDSQKEQDIKNPTFENKNLKSSLKKNNKKEKPLPWWVELLFVQIGLPDKLLIKILKVNLLKNGLLYEFFDLMLQLHLKADNAAEMI